MIAIISDIHGNLPALEAVLAEIEKYNCKKIISLGDISGYYSEPNKCLSILLEKNATQLLGNHDYYLIKHLSCPRSKTVSMLMEHQKKVMSGNDINYLSKLNSKYEYDNISCVHGGWENNTDEYLYEISENKLKTSRYFCFSGHTHVQTLFEFNSKIYCNPGSVGQPRDGDSRAAFAIFDNNKIHLKRVEYDIDKTVFLMQKAGYTNTRLWENLYIGAQIGGRIDKTVKK